MSDFWERQNQRKKEIRELKIGSSLYVQYGNQINEFIIASETKTLWKLTSKSNDETLRASSRTIYKEDLRDKVYSTAYYLTKITQEKLDEIEQNKKKVELSKLLEEVLRRQKRGNDFSQKDEELLMLLRKHREE